MFINLFFRFCCFHGPEKVHQRPEIPNEYVASLRCLLPSFLSALLYWLWEFGSLNLDLNDNISAIAVLHNLHASGWVTQKLIGDVLLDPKVYEKLCQGVCIV